MARLLVAFVLVALIACATARAETLPGQMLLSGNHVDLHVPATGEVRRVAEGGGNAALFPSGRELAYIRAVGCFPIGPESCYTEYSVFEKSLEEDAAAPGRGAFGPTDFFVRAVDVAPGGKLVFSAKPGPGPSPVDWARQMEIYSADLDGTGIRRLTHNEAFDNDPVVSPDGTRIAFSRRIRGRGQIFTMRIDGTDVVRVTRDRRRNRLPAWSPNGRRLVYLSQPPERGGWLDREIYTVSASGGPQRRLTYNKASEGEAAFSPDGRSIAFLLFNGVWAMGADGSSPRQILSLPGPPGYEDLDWGPLP